MSPQDEHKLTDFLTQLIQARGIQKDQEADALIQRAIAQQPDAAYLLVQRALLLEQGMNNARNQIASLQNQLSQQRGIEQDGQRGQQGDGRYPDANTWGNSGNARMAPPTQQYQPTNQQPYQPPYQPGYQSAPGPMGMGMGAPGGGLFGGGGGLRGTLGSIATTAAGVAAGSFLFQGLENMFSHHDGNGGNHLLNSDDPSNNLFNDQSGSGLADQAGLGDVDQSIGQPAEGLFDNSTDTGTLDDGGGQGFFDGDGSDDGLFS